MMLNNNQILMLNVFWTDNGEEKQTICDVKLASKILYELEVRKGIKGKFTLAE